MKVYFLPYFGTKSASSRYCFRCISNDSSRLSHILDFVLHCSACPNPWRIQVIDCKQPVICQHGAGSTIQQRDCMTMLNWVACSNLTCSLPLRFSKFHSCHFEALQLTGWHDELGFRADMSNDHDTKQRWTSSDGVCYMLHIFIYIPGQHLQLLPWSWFTCVICINGSLT